MVLLLFFKSTMAARYVGSGIAIMLGRKTLILDMSVHSASLERFAHKLAGEGHAMADATTRPGCSYISAISLVEVLFNSSTH